MFLDAYDWHSGKARPIAKDNHEDSLEDSGDAPNGDA